MDVFLLVGAVATSGGHGLQLLFFLGRVFGRGQFPIVEFGQFSRGIAADAAKGVVELDVLARHGGERDAERRQFIKAAQFLFVEAQGCYGILLVGNVDEYADQHLGLARSVIDRTLEGVGGAVLLELMVPDLFLEVDDLAFAENLAVLL